MQATSEQPSISLVLHPPHQSEDMADIEQVGCSKYHKYGSTYSRTEPENAKTGCQDLSPSARWPRTEFIYVFLMCVSKLMSVDQCTKKL